MALARRLSVITGPPGSGKSSILREIELRVRAEGGSSGSGAMESFIFDEEAVEAEEEGDAGSEGEDSVRGGNASCNKVISALLLAPTGKAAQVMRACIGDECPAEVFTIAMALLSPKVVAKYKGGWCTIIIDEASMVSVLDLYKIVSGFEPRRLVLVGDADQLPPVGARGVLCDLLDVAPTTRLTKVFRQNANTSLYRNIARVRAEREDVSLAFRDEDASFSVVGRGSDWKTSVDERGYEKGGDTFVERLLKRDPQCPLVFLCGTRAAKVRVNLRAQRCLNSSGVSLAGMYKSMRVGDPVCCDRNHREATASAGGGGRKLLVSNGTLGVVRLIEDVPCVVYEGFTDKFDWKRKKFATRFSLAYAFTVHKAQGGQFENVAVVLDGGVQLSLLYTAMSRASRSCVIVRGEELSVRRGHSSERSQSAFSMRLVEELRNQI